MPETSRIYWKVKIRLQPWRTFEKRAECVKCVSKVSGLVHELKTNFTGRWCPKNNGDVNISCAFNQNGLQKLIAKSGTVWPRRPGWWRRFSHGSKFATYSWWVSFFSSIFWYHLLKLVNLDLWILIVRPWRIGPTAATITKKMKPTVGSLETVPMLRLLRPIKCHLE